MSRIIANAYRHTGASADAITLDSSGNVTFPANATCSGTATGFGGGKILQVKNAIKTDTQSVTNDNNGNFTDVTGLSLSITPSSSSNKVLFRGYVAMSCEANSTLAIRIFRDSTEIGKSTADSTAANNSTATAKCLNVSTSTIKNAMYQLQFEVLDSPNTTSATTYKVKFAETHLHNYQSVTAYINRPHTGMSADNNGVISSITAMEVAA